jgi:hypothetical protein
MERYSKDYCAGLGLMKLENLHIYHSACCGRDARVLGKVADDAYGYLKSYFDEKPEIVLLVLNKSDWEERVSPNQPYGNPFMPDNRVYYGVRPPESWIEPLSLLADGAPTELREKLVSIAGLGPCTTREAVEKIFTLDLFSFTLVHEFAHPFLAQNLVLPQPIEFKYAFKLDAFWLGEFLPQYIMYSFLKGKDRHSCEKWLTLMKSVFEGGKGRVKHTKLTEMGLNYHEMIGSCVENIYWYQAKLFLMSADLFKLHGEDFIRKVQEDLRINERLLLNQINQSFRRFREWLRIWE